MPLTKSQLESRRDLALKKIRDNQRKIDGIIREFTTIPFIDSNHFFKNLMTLSKEELRRFVNCLPESQEILDLMRRTAEEELKRRDVEEKIQKIMKKKEMEARQLFRSEKKKEKRLQKKLGRVSRNEESSSSESQSQQQSLPME